MSLNLNNSIISIENRYKNIIISISFFLILLPKINILNIGNESAGIRIDDVLIAIFILIIFFERTKSGSICLIKIEKEFFIFILYSIAMVVYHSLVYKRSSFLYAIRPFEYFAFFYIGFYFYKTININKLLTVLITLNLIVSVAQLNNIIGGFASRGYRVDTSERVIGLTGGPWEIGAICNIAICYFLFGSSKTNKKNWLLIIMSSIIIILTQARAPLAILAITFLFYLFNSTSIKKLMTFAALTLTLTIGFILGDGLISGRSESLFSLENIKVIETYYDKINVQKNLVGSDKNAGLEYEWDYSAGYDTSWLARLYKWIYIYKVWISSVFFLIFGVGPGVWGTAVDGGWIRLLTEYGSIGFLLFFRFFKNAFSKIISLRWVCYAFFANMIFIDMYMSYKFMSILFLIIGSTYRSERDSN